MCASCSDAGAGVQCPVILINNLILGAFLARQATLADPVWVPAWLITSD